MFKVDTETKLKQFYEVVKVTPLSYAKYISEQSRNQVYLKREDAQVVHSFKLRGAYYKMLQLDDVQLHNGVIAASSGNHAQGVALAAKLLDCSALIVMPTTTPQIKVNAVKRLGAETVLYGESYSEAYAHSLEVAARDGRTFIHPFDDEQVIAGQSTVGQEIFEQLPSADYIFVPVGGGGLLAGVIQAAQDLGSNTKIIGVEPSSSNAMTRSIEAGYPIELDEVGLFADGVAVKRVGDIPLEVASRLVYEMVNVSDKQISQAIKQLFEEDRSILEPAGATALAGLMKFASQNNLRNKHLVAICSGANLTFESLIHIAEKMY